MINIKYIPFILFVGVFLAIPQNSNAQFWKKLQKHVEKKVEKEAEKRTNKKADEAVDEAFDTVEEGAEDAVTGESEKSEDQQKKTKVNKEANENERKEQDKESEEKSVTHSPEIKWAKFDFVPGDEVIFEDGPSLDEENGEFPSRWDLKRGNVEIAEMDGENVIMFHSTAEIIPYLKNPKEEEYNIPSRLVQTKR